MDRNKKLAVAGGLALGAVLLSALLTKSEVKPHTQAPVHTVAKPSAQAPTHTAVKTPVQAPSHTVSKTPIQAPSATPAMVIYSGQYIPYLTVNPTVNLVYNGPVTGQIPNLQICNFNHYLIDVGSGRQQINGFQVVDKNGNPISGVKLQPYFVDPTNLQPVNFQICLPVIGYNPNSSRTNFGVIGSVCESIILSTTTSDNNGNFSLIVDKTLPKVNANPPQCFTPGNWGGSTNNFDNPSLNPPYNNFFIAFKDVDKVKYLAPQPSSFLGTHASLVSGRVTPYFVMHPNLSTATQYYTVYNVGWGHFTTYASKKTLYTGNLSAFVS